MSTIDVDEILEHQLNANMLLMPYDVYSELFDSIDSLGVELDKLRELLSNVGNTLFSLDVDYCGACKADNANHPCPVYTVKGGECPYKTAMRELGIEVD